MKNRGPLDWSKVVLPEEIIRHILFLSRISILSSRFIVPAMDCFVLVVLPMTMNVTLNVARECFAYGLATKKMRWLPKT
ncbi:hypothetical protein O6P43_027102 [Quillaja saponaria]|uniref:Uncharacterized protein n=1 Tax=Quillaja saponaria TaxID=32244 RepID=A0AAD7PCZ5_QUISA|nr:hypothetical protein O6P43_027102 [Quillaja saponaria]